MTAFALDPSPNLEFERFPETALDGSIIECFRVVARRHADRTAVCDATESLSYADLSRLAERIGSAVAAATSNRSGQVAIALRNEARYAAAMLGVLAAGRAFVPLNLDHPAERNRQIIEHAETVAVVTTGDAGATLRFVLPDDVTVLDLDALRDCPKLPLLSPTGPDDLAYIAYTSGSTGRPKGVARHHRALLHYVLQTTNAMEMTSADRFVLFNSPSVTQDLILTFCGLLNGASVYCLPPADFTPAALAATLQRHRISLLWSAPRLFRHLVEALPSGQRFDTLRLVSLAGDRVDWQDIARVRRGCAPGVRVRVGFGSTEAGVHTQWIVDENLRGSGIRLPVGTAPPGQALVIVDEAGEPVADGEIGEAIVTSRSVALGYWRDPDATARAFSDNLDDPAARVFRTGDLVMRRADGLIEYVGRKDQQVKLAGNRIELAEVESALMSCRGVRDAAVVVRRHESGAPRSLAAYCELTSDTAGTTPRELDAMLRDILPRYMIPGSITVVAELPRLGNFKLDRETLARAAEAARDEQPASTPRTPTEAVLAELWAEALEADEIGRDDDFFELGGDSLAAATIAVGVQETLGGEVNLGLISENPTLAELAAAIEAMTPPPDRMTEPALVPVSRNRPLALSHIQRLIWNGSQTPDGAAGFVDTTAYRLAGPLDRQALGEAIDFIVRRHESLRTTFNVVDGEPVQLVHPATPMPIPLLDVANAANPVVEARRLVGDFRGHITDLRQGPLLSFKLIRLSDNEHWLVQTTNHIVCDNYSRAILFGELAALYVAFRRREPAPLAEQASRQYADYAAWERRRLNLDNPRWQKEITWWEAVFRDAPEMQEPPFLRKSPLRGADIRDGDFHWAMPRALPQATIAFARDQRTTPYIVRLAALTALLAATMERREIIVGTVVDSRNRPELQEVIGNFVNFVTLRLTVDPALSFSEWLRTVREQVAEAVSHRELPAPLLTKTLAARGVTLPLAHVWVQSFVLARMSLAGLDEIDPVDRRYTVMPPNFLLTFREHSDDSDCSVAFDARRYDASKVHRFIDRFVCMLELSLAYPAMSMGELTLMSRLPRRLAHYVLSHEWTRRVLRAAPRASRVVGRPWPARYARYTAIARRC